MRIEGCLASPHDEACIWMGADGGQILFFIRHDGCNGCEGSSVLSKVSEGCMFARFYAHNVA